MHIYKSLPSVCVSVCVSLLSLLRKDLTVKTFPRQIRNDRDVVFYEVHVASGESRRAVVPITSCFLLRFTFLDCNMVSSK
jgi:hypothetical protein